MLPCSGQNIVLTSKCKGIAGERCGHKGHAHRAMMNCRLGAARGGDLRGGSREGRGRGVGRREAVTRPVRPPF